CGRFTEAFVGSAPAVVLRHGDTRSEVPVNAGAAHLDRGDAVNFFDERWVARAAEADVMREDHGAEDVAMPMHGVNTVEQRYAKSCSERLLLAVVVRFCPCLGRIAFFRVGVAAAKDRAKSELTDIAKVAQVLQVGLRHLPDLLGERHPTEQLTG